MTRNIFAELMEGMDALKKQREGERMIDVQARYNEVEKFNEIAGNLKHVDVESIESQIKLVKEEVEELDYAFDSENATELLDGACDAFVTVMGLLQKMDRAGFKVNEALQLVNQNNLSKFPTAVSQQEREAYEWNFWEVTHCAEHNCYVLKDENGKIRKPAGFKSVDLMDCLPSDFFGWNDEFGGVA